MMTMRIAALWAITGGISLAGIISPTRGHDDPEEAKRAMRPAVSRVIQKASGAE